MQQRSSMTITPAEPIAVPACGERVEVERDVDLVGASAPASTSRPG